MIDDQGVGPAGEELGQADLAGSPRIIEGVEGVILRDLAAGRQRASCGRDGFHGTSERDFFVEQALAGPAIFVGFVGEDEVMARS